MTLEMAAEMAADDVSCKLISDRHRCTMNALSQLVSSILTYVTLAHAKHDHDGERELRREKRVAKEEVFISLETIANLQGPKSRMEVLAPHFDIKYTHL